MLRFKSKDIEKRLEERKAQFTLSAYPRIRKIIDGGAEGISPYVLTYLCGELNCRTQPPQHFVSTPDC